MRPGKEGQQRAWERGPLSTPSVSAIYNCLPTFLQMRPLAQNGHTVCGGLVDASSELYQIQTFLLLTGMRHATPPPQCSLIRPPLGGAVTSVVTASAFTYRTPEVVYSDTSCSWYLGFSRGSAHCPVAPSTLSFSLCALYTRRRSSLAPLCWVPAH